MSIRSLISKEDRVKVVTWIRSGAPLKEGVLLYSALPFNQALLNDLKRDPEGNEHRLISEICRLMDIPKSKFESIIKQYHGKRYSETKLTARRGSQTLDAKNHSGSESQRKTQRSFRNEWPFLSRPECPPELKALAADKITAWERYTEAHKKLFDCTDIEECYNSAREVIENYKENRLIYSELEHYKEHGAILGKHRIWSRYRRFNELRRKNVIELVRLHERTLPHRIWRIESEIRKGDKPHLLAEREARLLEFRTELAEVKRLIGIKEE